MFRIVTYNVHHCRGRDGQVSPSRIADVLASARAEIVALQELDVGRPRSFGVDQADAIARELGMHTLFHPSFSAMGEQYGNAILTARPAELVKTGTLPGRSGLEPRGALWACMRIGGLDLQLINTHLGLRGRERLLQIECLLGPGWLGHAGCKPPVLLLGDLNAVPRSRVYRLIARRLADAAQGARRAGALNTFPSWLPLARLDHVFFTGPIAPLRVETLRTPLARIASDHLPLVVEFRPGERRTCPAGRATADRAR